MNTHPEKAYLNPEGFSRPIPLERFMPLCPAGVITQYFSKTQPEEGWTLDPFGSNPLLDLEAAACGKKVIAACNNPITAFVLKLLAISPEKGQFLGALAEFSSLYRGEERLETHLKNLYLTRCVICHNEIQAAGYLWRRGEAQPYARLYRCPHCGDEGERAITEEDLSILLPVQRGEKIHYARAIGRVLHGSEEERPAVEEALKLYGPRALYVLFTLLNKLEGMAVSPERRTLLEALLLSALDAGTSLWAWPSEPEPPRQLTLPTEYLEKNLWTEIEQAVDLWSQPSQPVALTIFPNLPEGAGICLFPGPVRALELPPEIKVEQLLCLPPRPNQAYWTLSALWSAWLWGREEATSFSGVLGRRRFDWHWHTLALHQALERSGQWLTAKGKMFLQIGEPSAGMVLATYAAGRYAGFNLQGTAMRSVQAPIQTWWQKSESEKASAAGNVQNIVREAIRNHLIETGEPADYLTLFTAAVEALTLQGGFPGTIRDYSQEKSSELQGVIARIFADRDFLRRFEVTSQELDSGKWGLMTPQGLNTPLADRLEIELVNLFQEKKKISIEEIDLHINAHFPGLVTPAKELVEYTLASYAAWDAGSRIWQLNEGDQSVNRRQDVKKVVDLLRKLAEKFGYGCSGEIPVLQWMKENTLVYRFFISAGAQFARHAYQDYEDQAQNVFVFPGSRSALIKFKLDRDPQLRERVAHDWHFLKFRTVRALAGRPEITPEIWSILLDGDPINVEETTQLRMFG